MADPAIAQTAQSAQAAQQPASQAVQPAAPTQAPAAQVAAPAAQEAPKPTAEQAFGKPTGDAGLDLALNFLAGHGYNAESPAIIAAKSGDFSLLKAELAAKGVQGAAEYAALAEQGYKRLAEADEAKTESIRQLVYEEVGGEEAWEQVHEWAKENVQPEQHEAINAALLQGGIVASAMAQYLASQMNATGNVAPASPVVGERAGAAPATNGTLTMAEYQAEVRKLSQAKRGLIDGTPEYLALQRRLRI